MDNEGTTIIVDDNRLSTLLFIIIIIVIAVLSGSPYAPEQDIELENWARENNIKIIFGSDMFAKYVNKDEFKNIIIENNIKEIELDTTVGYHYVIEIRKICFNKRFYYYKNPGDP